MPRPLSDLSRSDPRTDGAGLRGPSADTNRGLLWQSSEPVWLMLSRACTWLPALPPSYRVRAEALAAPRKTRSTLPRLGWSVGSGAPARSLRLPRRRAADDSSGDEAAPVGAGADVALAQFRAPRGRGPRDRSRPPIASQPTSASATQRWSRPTVIGAASRYRMPPKRGSDEISAASEDQARRGRVDALPLCDSERVASPARVADPAHCGH
jgi:hypothetical protein